MSGCWKGRGKNMPAAAGVFFLFLFVATVGTGAVRAQDTATALRGAPAAVTVVPEEHSASKALMLSLLPGAGQVYNGQAWKVPVIYGAFAGMGYAIHYYYSRMSMFKDEYLYRINNGTPSLEDYAAYPNSSIYNLYNSYNRNFQLMVIITVGVYALNLIDAYVFGHLYDFQIDDNLSMSLVPGVQPTPDGLRPTLGFSFRF